MGRSIRVRGGLLVREDDPGDRKKNKAEHAKHKPNPNKLRLTQRQQEGFLFPAQKAETSPAMKEMDVRRREILSEAVRLNVIGSLSPGYQERLQTRFTGSPQPLEEEAMKEALDSIQFIMLRLKSRAECELLRLKLQLAVITGGPLAKFIEPNVIYDLNEVTPRTLRHSTCDERSAHYREAIAKYLPPGS